MKRFAALPAGRHSPARLLWAVGALCCAGPALPASACQEKVVWQADLTGSPSVSPAPAPASGTAAATGTAVIQFDFVHPAATLQVETKNLKDVRALELHISRSYSDHTGPVVVTLYSAVAGQLPATFTKRFTEADLQPQATPKVGTFFDLVQMVLDGRAFVTITTQSHPTGDLSGFITMRKEIIYSDDSADPAHDPILHHAAQAAPAKS